MPDETADSTWTEVRVRAPRGWSELVVEALSTGPCGSAAIVPGDDSESELVRASFLHTADTDARRDEIRARLAALATTTGCEELGALEVEFLELADRDWAEAWRETWRPFRVGDLAVVTPEWDGPLRPTDRRLDLVPGGTFGTGRHATTRRCLQVVQERLEGGARVLDVGTGTGILAVAAAMCGASSALGFDLDPASEPAARELARANAVDDRCEFRTGGFEVLHESDGPFDVLLANLYSDLIQQHANELASVVRPGGWFAVSGCPIEHVERTANALREVGFALDRTHRRGRWVTLVGTRPRGH